MLLNCQNKLWKISELFRKSVQIFAEQAEKSYRDLATVQFCGMSRSGNTAREEGGGVEEGGGEEGEGRRGGEKGRGEGEGRRGGVEAKIE